MAHIFRRQKKGAGDRCKSGVPTPGFLKKQPCFLFRQRLDTGKKNDWMSQAKHDAEAGGEGRLPAVFHKKNNHAILVTMELDDFMKIYQEYEAGLRD